MFRVKTSLDSIERIAALVIFESTVDVLCISDLSGLYREECCTCDIQVYIFYVFYASLDSIERNAAPVVFESKCSFI
jgi:hypothetical protein